MTLLLITGHTAAGKTATADALQIMRPNLTIFEQDKVCGPMTGAALSLVGISSHTRGGTAYARLRDATYETLLECARPVLSHGGDVALVAPYWPEMNRRPAAAPLDFQTVAEGLGHDVRTVWLTCSPEVRKRRLWQRAPMPVSDEDNTEAWIESLQDPQETDVDLLLNTDSTTPEDIALQVDALLG